MDPLDAHFVAAMSILARHSPRTCVVETRDSVAIVAVGAGRSAFNSAWVIGAPLDPQAATSSAVATLRATGRPFGFLVPGPFRAEVGAPLETLGLTQVATMPGMVRGATTDLPAVPAGLRIEAVRDDVALRRHRVATAIGFGDPEPQSLDLVMPSTLLDDERVMMFNGHVDGGQEPAATAVCVLAGGLAGIYAVTTHEAWRRRGIGEAMTWAAVAAGASAGAGQVVLQASPLGEPVYRHMGFETVRHYYRYERSG